MSRHYVIDLQFRLRANVVDLASPAVNPSNFFAMVLPIRLIQRSTGRSLGRLDQKGVYYGKRQTNRTAVERGVFGSGQTTLGASVAVVVVNNNSDSPIPKSVVERWTIYYYYYHHEVYCDSNWQSTTVRSTVLNHDNIVVVLVRRPSDYWLITCGKMLITCSRPVWPVRHEWNSSKTINYGLHHVLYNMILLC